MDSGTLYELGLALTFLGILIVIAAALILLLSNIRRKGETKGGGAIIIGPIPIVFGTDKESLRTLLLLSIMLTILLIAATIVMHFMSK